MQKRRLISLLTIIATVICSSLDLSSEAQSAKPQDEKKQSSGGASTAGAFKPIKDALSRPITAGGFVDGAPVIFNDITSRTGIKFLHRAGTPEKRYLPDTASGGVALFDYDNDGWLDVYLVNGSTVEALNAKAKVPRSALYRNKGDGTFTDVTDRAGVENERWGFGAASGDYDNDGWTDIYVTNLGRNRLYRNNGDGTFTDVAEKMGVAVDTWSTGATFGDYDGDGRLDLFVAGYVDFD